jgi:hypothetical protein
MKEIEGEELRTINRGVIVVIPKKPFYDWANYLDPEHPLSVESFDEHNAYLIKDDFSDIEKVVKKHFKLIFEEELFGMWTEEADWPKTRTFKVFKEWFDYHVSSVVYDLGRGGIIHDSY